MRRLNVVLTAAAAVTLSAAPLSAQWGILGRGSDRNPNGGVYDRNGNSCRYVERVIAGRVIRQRVCDNNGGVYDRNDRVYDRNDRVYDRNGNVIYRREGVDHDGSRRVIYRGRDGVWRDGQGRVYDRRGNVYERRGRVYNRGRGRGAHKGRRNDRDSD